MQECGFSLIYCNFLLLSNIVFNYIEPSYNMVQALKLSYKYMSVDWVIIGSGIDFLPVLSSEVALWYFNILGPEHNGKHSADNISKCIFMQSFTSWFWLRFYQICFLL